MRNKVTGVRLVGALALVSACVAITGCNDDEPVIGAGTGGNTGKGGTGGTTAGSGGSTAGSGGATAGSGGSAGATGGASGAGGASGKGGSSGAGAGGASGAGAGGASGKGGASGAGAGGASGAGAGGVSGAGAGGTAGSAGAGGNTAGLIDPTKTKTITSPAVTIFDAVPSNDGTTVFFTGLLADGTGAIFSGPAAGGAGTRLGTATFVVPSGLALSSDGNTLYVADVSATDDGVSDKGRVYSVTTAGAATPLSGLDGFGVRGIAIRATAGSPDVLLVSGSDPATGKAGIYKADATGAGATLVTDAIREPSGLVAVGDLTYAIDGAGALLTIALAGTTTSAPLPGAVGFPAGVAAANDGTLYVSSATTSNLFTFDIAAKTFTTTSVPLAAGTEGGGLHKARGAAVFSLVDGTAAGTGAVYVLTP